MTSILAQRSTSVRMTEQKAIQNFTYEVQKLKLKGKPEKAQLELLIGHTKQALISLVQAFQKSGQTQDAAKAKAQDSFYTKVLSIQIKGLPSTVEGLVGKKAITAMLKSMKESSCEPKIKKEPKKVQFNEEVDVVNTNTIDIEDYEKELQEDEEELERKKQEVEELKANQTEVLNKDTRKVGKLKKDATDNKRKEFMLKQLDSPKTEDADA